MRHVGTASIEHVAMSVSLRAPRVAIVVPTTENWHFIAATAIHRATHIWGGAGFILVPHDKGRVDDRLLQVAVAYDPDHVVSIGDASLAALLDAGSCEWSPNVLDAGSNADTDVPLSPHDASARARVSDACTPYRTGDQSDGSTYEVLDYLRKGRTAGAPLLGIEPDYHGTELRLSVHHPEERDAALIRAERQGLVNPPDSFPLVTRRPDQPDPSLFLPREDDRFGTFDYWADEESGWRTSLTGLVSVGSPAVEPIASLVIGSGFNDFALSYALARIDGYSAWIPDGWLSPASNKWKYVHSLASSIRWRDSGGARVRVASSSISSSGLATLIKDLHPLSSAIEMTGRRRVEFAGADERLIGLGNRHLALIRDYDHDLVLPVRRETDRETLVLANPFPAVVPESNLSDLSPMPIWHLDVEMSSASTPRGRNIGWHLFQESDNGNWPERTRSGRDGVSVSSQSFGVVPAGASLRQRLARPILRFPSAMSWVRAMAGRDGYDASVSAAGHKAKIAAEIWGGRDAMADSMAAGMPLFNEFMCSSSEEQSKDRYPHGDGCAIRGEGFLTFDALRRVSQTADDDVAQLRTTVDELDSLGVIRRGMILGCPSCTRVQWIPASQITTATCSRCQADIPLNRASWKYPVEEPLWFYDLHPVVRDVIAECGHVAILGGRHVQRDIRGGSTVLPDIEFKRSGDHFEIDLVVTSRRKVTVGECKNRPEIPRDEVTKKLHALVRSAVVLRADEIVLAAGQPGTWDVGFVTKLAERVEKTAWIAGRPPRIRLLTDVLGDVTDHYHEIGPTMAGSEVANG